MFCLICSDISLEIFEHGEDAKKKHSKNVILLEMKQMRMYHTS